MILEEEGRPRAAVQRAMLVRFSAAKNPKTKKKLVEEIGELDKAIISNLRKVEQREANRLAAEYKVFADSYERATSSPQK